MRKVVHFQCLKDVSFEGPEIAGLLRAGCLAPEELVVIPALKAPTRPTMLAGATHVTIGGSGWSVWEDIPYKRELRETITAAVTEFGIPTLGICFGAQFLADIFGGTVVRDESRAEKGVTRVHRVGYATGDPLFDDAPSSFEVISAHHDCIAILPLDCMPLAHSQDRAVIQAFTSVIDRCWGVQFHPEHGVGDDARVLERFFNL